MIKKNSVFQKINWLLKELAENCAGSFLLVLKLPFTLTHQTRHTSKCERVSSEALRGGIDNKKTKNPLQLSTTPPQAHQTLPYQQIKNPQKKSDQKAALKSIFLIIHQHQGAMWEMRFWFLASVQNKAYLNIRWVLYVAD